MLSDSSFSVRWGISFADDPSSSAWCFSPRRCGMSSPYMCSIVQANLSQDRIMHNQVFRCIYSDLVSHSRDNCNPSAHVTTSGRSSTAIPTRRGSLNRNLRSHAGPPPRTSPLRYPNQLHILALNLLSRPRHAIRHLHPPLVLHARLPEHQPRRLQLFQIPLLDPPDPLPRTRSRTSLLHHLLHRRNIHLFLDNPDIPPCRPPLQLRLPDHRPLRPRGHRINVSRSHLGALRNRSLRPSFLCRTGRALGTPRRHNRNLYRSSHYRWTHPSSLLQRFRDADCSDR